MYMEKAIQVAKDNLKKNEYPFGCCIVYQENVITAGNSCFTESNPLRHAEINAINKLIDGFGMRALRDSVIYTTTEPCLMCLGAINWSNIPRLVYGTSVKASKELGFGEVYLTIEEVKANFSYDLQVESGVLIEECMELLRLWKEKNKRFIKFLGK
jgi:tRNA(Arg) A34 adenosine deaminase TadA